jgi:uncharacterized protein YcbK (DUF882 family)
MGDLSPHFSKVELACRCCGELKIEKRLVDALEELRSLAGKPIVIHDGYRCERHNQEVGGVTDSEHVRGMAADVDIPGLSLQQQYELAVQVPDFVEGGIGVYDSGFLHVDVRLTRSRWARVKGQYVGVHHLVREPMLLAKLGTSSSSG